MIGRLQDLVVRSVRSKTGRRIEIADAGTGLAVLSLTPDESRGLGWMLMQAGKQREGSDE